MLLSGSSQAAVVRILFLLESVNMYFIFCAHETRNKGKDVTWELKKKKQQQQLTGFGKEQAHK